MPIRAPRICSWPTITAVPTVLVSCWRVSRSHGRRRAGRYSRSPTMIAMAGMAVSTLEITVAGTGPGTAK
jgi:hypothetical protein